MSNERTRNADETNNLDRLLDVNKQITTLSAGAAVLLATFWKDIVPGNLSDNWAFVVNGALALAICLYFVSILLSVTAMLATTHSGLMYMTP